MSGLVFVAAMTVIAIVIAAWDIHKKRPFAGMGAQLRGETEQTERWSRTAPAAPTVPGRECSYCHTVCAPWKGTCPSCGAPLTTKGRTS